MFQPRVERSATLGLTGRLKDEALKGRNRPSPIGGPLLRPFRASPMLALRYPRVALRFTLGWNITPFQGLSRRLLPLRRCEWQHPRGSLHPPVASPRPSATG